MTWRVISTTAGALVCAASILFLVSCAPTETEPGAAEVAHELRMNGKLGEAKQVLEDALAQDLDYAAGHYELSRLKVHAAMANSRQIEALMNEAQQSIDQAVEHDSSSAIYPFFGGYVGFMRAFIALNLGEPGAAEKVVHTCESFAAALRVEPNYREAKLHLVELYGLLPEEMGGDRSKAEAYMSELAAEDEIFGMKARSVLEEVGVEDWKPLREKYPRSTNILEELGKAYLWAGDAAEAGKCFAEAVEIDSSKVVLYLDLGRYHTMRAMDRETKDEESQELQQSHLAAAEAAVRRYLEIDPPAPLKAYALRMLEYVKRTTGEQDEAEKLKAEAKALDPHHTRASTRPSNALFTPPGTLFRDHGYMMRPF
ncbi:tetratricopeptide repeat protein [Candidatus Eisenbacteria bacterium]|uniref:Tetratricopeptide repeat protein n=1 Tax=Eiseniibacteriota bacterium TaxID=2212470 RepID=A0ABV6YIA1_UNCEI